MRSCHMAGTCTMVLSLAARYSSCLHAPAATATARSSRMLTTFVSARADSNCASWLEDDMSSGRCRVSPSRCSWGRREGLVVTIIFASACAATSATSAAFMLAALLPSTSGPTTLGSNGDATGGLSESAEDEPGRMRAHMASRQRTAPSRTMAPRLALSSARFLKVSAMRWH